MNVLIKGRCNNYDSWREVFDGHKARAEVCDESRTLDSGIASPSAALTLSWVLLPVEIDLKPCTAEVTAPATKPTLPPTAAAAIPPTAVPTEVDCKQTSRATLRQYKL